MSRLAKDKPTPAKVVKPMVRDINGHRNPRARATDPETGEVLLREEPETDDGPQPSDRRTHGKAEKALYLQKAEQTLRWQQLKNEEKEKELQLKLGTLVELDVIKKQVLAANFTVKQQVLAVIERANLPHETRVRLKHQMIEALNELAYEHGAQRPHA